MKNNFNQPDAYQKGWVEFYKQSLKNSTKNIPKAYINGYIEFYKLRFKVTPDVLIPRPETELLVDEILNFLALQGQALQGYTPSILDIGTGSGNIAISIAKNLQQYLTSKHLTSGVRVNIIATDVSEKALKIARQNAKLHGVENKIEFIQSDLLNFIARSEATTRLPAPEPRPITQDAVVVDGRSDGGQEQSDKKIASNIDIIVANLPYIPSARIPYLDKSVKDFEPHIALDGGEDGFDLYRKLFSQIMHTPLRCVPKCVRCVPKCVPKLIVGEIDYTHGEIAQSEAQKYFPKAKVEVKFDLAHKQRMLIIKY